MVIMDNTIPSAERSEVRLSVVQYSTDGHQAELTDDRRAIVRAVGEFAEREIAPLVAEYDAQEYRAPGSLDAHGRSSDSSEASYLRNTVVWGWTS